MSIELLSSAPAGTEGIIHRLRVDHFVFGVRVRLLPDGRWLVRIETADQAGGTAEHPLEAFRIAKDIAEQQTRGRGLGLSWREVEDLLCEAGAFAVDVPLDLSLPEWRAVGLAVTHPDLPQTATLEADPSFDAFLRQAYGLGEGPWRVVGARWEDFGRRMVVGVHFGRHHPASP